jgi:NAD(P)-dependent dehydrogenase (short-subunit alcohol dehydrogenase family)
LFVFYEQFNQIYYLCLVFFIQYTVFTVIDLTLERRRNNMSNKIAIITGGSRGLGKNAALALANKGVDVILTYHSKQAEAAAVVAEIEKTGARAVALQLDVGNSQSFDAFAAQVKKVLQQKWERQNFDYLVNNAGIGIHTSFAETTEAQFDQLLNIQFKGVFFLTQKMLPLIADHGRILNISSGLTRFSFPGYAAYASMKGAIEVLTKYLAKELGPRGISVNVVAPGAIETDFGGGAVRDNAQLNQMIASQTALGRVGVPDDIGGVIASLLSDDNRWINAQRIEASGGMLI